MKHVKLIGYIHSNDASTHNKRESITSHSHTEKLTADSHVLPTIIEIKSQSRVPMFLSGEI